MAEQVVYPSNEQVQVVEPSQAEKAEVVYPITVPEVREIQEPEVSDNDIDESEEDEMEETETTTTTNAVNFYIMEEDSQETTMAPEVTRETTMTTVNVEDNEIMEEQVKEDENYNDATVRHHENEEDAPEVQDSFEANWEEKEIILGLDGNNQDCFNMDQVEQRFITVLSRIFVTVTETLVVTETQANRVHFKSQDACLPTNVNAYISSTCS